MSDELVWASFALAIGGVLYLLAFVIGGIVMWFRPPEK